ncbi:MAG: cytochrome P450, partial [Mycobacterium sp.]
MNKTSVAVSGPDSEAAHAVALEDIDVSDPELYRNYTWQPYFKRLREEDPVHFCKDSMFGPYWSITKFADIMQVDTSPEIFSSEAKFGGITIMDDNAAASLPMFIAMDPPKHDAQRLAVSPIVA